MNQISSTFLEYPDNFSIATIFYFTGCDRFCKGCHNLDLQTYQPIDKEIVCKEIINYCNRLGTNKVVLCGGDPLYSKNIATTKFLLDKLSKEYDICIYTGADIEEAKKVIEDSKLFGFKFIKCGKFKPELYIGSSKSDSFIKFATSNQELYDENFKLLTKDGIYYF